MPIKSIFDVAVEKAEEAFAASTVKKPFYDARDYMTRFLTEAKERNVIDSFEVVDKDPVKGLNCVQFIVSGAHSEIRYGAKSRAKKGDFYIRIEHKGNDEKFSVAVTPIGTQKIMDVVADKFDKRPVNHGGLREYDSFEHATAQVFLQDVAEMLAFSQHYFADISKGLKPNPPESVPS